LCERARTGCIFVLLTASAPHSTSRRFELRVYEEGREKDGVIGLLHTCSHAHTHTHTHPSLAHAPSYSSLLKTTLNQFLSRLSSPTLDRFSLRFSVCLYSFLFGNDHIECAVCCWCVCARLLLLCNAIARVRTATAYWTEATADVHYHMLARVCSLSLHTQSSS